MVTRGNRRRARSTALAAAYGLLAVLLTVLGYALISSSLWMLRAAAIVAVLGAFAATMLVRHQLFTERVAHGEDRAQLSQNYSRLTSDRVVANAEFVDLVNRRLDEIEEEVATVIHAGDKYSGSDAPTVIDLKPRGLAAS